MGARLASMTALIAIAALATVAHAGSTTGPSSVAARRFHFTPGDAPAGSVYVSPDTLYTADGGYGFEPASPTRFSVAVPEGNYNVTVTLGNASVAAVTTINAESRRLMLQDVRTGPGERVTRTFTVNVRNSSLPSGGSVRLKDREKGVLHWDDKLTLEFTGKQPAVAAVEIEKVEDAITVFLAGDSTVTDQVGVPYYAWGQALPRFFKPGVAIANHAESGEALKSFLAEKRLEKIAGQMKPGDYLFVQFGHNDQKKGSAYVEPFTTYKEHLKLFIKAARDHGATPVLVTSMHRRRFDDAGKIINTHGDYPEAVRQSAAEEKIALIDLHAMSKTLFEALGPEASKEALLHYPANTFPGQDKPINDDTHFSFYGGYELAKCVVEGIKANKLDLAKHLADDVPPFDPAKPDPVDSF